MKTPLTISAALLCLSLTAHAQFEISTQGTFETILDELKWVYKPGSGFVLTLSKYEAYRKKRASSFGFNLGYSKYNVKQDLFYYLVNADEVGTIKYSDMQVFQFGVQLRRDYAIRKQVELYYGMEIGIYYTKYKYEAHDPYFDESSTNIVGRGAVSPKAGINYQFNERIGAFIQTRYLLTFAKSADAVNSKNVVNFYWVNSVGLNFRLGDI